MNSPNPPQRRQVIGYLRVSTECQHKLQDLDRQRARLEIWADANGYVIVAIYADVARGSNFSAASRSDLYRAYEHAKRADLPILVTEPSRLARHRRGAELLNSLRPVEGYLFIARKDDSITWVEEVERYHEGLPAVISEGTVLAMDGQKRRGKKFGSPDRLKKAREISLDVRRSKMDVTISKVADVLSERPENRQLSLKALSDELNARGIRTANGNTFNKDRVREPRAAALKLLEVASRQDKLMIVDFPAEQLEMPPAVSVTVPEPAQDQGDESEDDTRRSPLWGMF